MPDPTMTPNMQPNTLNQPVMPPTMQPVEAMPIAEDEEELPTEEKEYKESDYIIPVKLTDAIETKIKQIFRDEMATIQKERSEMYEGNGLEQQIIDNQNLYDGITEAPQLTWSSANYHVWITTMMVDIATIKAKEHTFSANPIILLEPSDEMSQKEQKEDLRDREDRLDYKLRKDVEIENIMHPVYRETFIQGTSFVKVAVSNDIEWCNYKHIYEITPEELQTYNEKKTATGDIKRFETDFPNHFSNEVEHKNFTKLLSEGIVTVQIEEQKQIYYGTKITRIPLEKLWLRPKIKDLRRQTVIAEEKDYVWSDIEKRGYSDYYIKDKVDELKDRASEEYWKKDYCIFEFRLFADLGDGKMSRYIITMDKDSEIILRAIYFPYEHHKLDIVAFYIMPKDDNAYGYGFCERMQDNNKMLDNSWNILFNTYTWAHNPLIVTNDPDTTFGGQDWAPLSVVKLKAGPDAYMKPLELTYPKTDTLVITQYSERFSEFATGITAGMSGRENAADPSAPASKTAMLLEESNLRVKDYIKELLKSIALIGELVEKTELQFKPNQYDYLKDGYNVSVNKSIYMKNVRYVAHGLTVSIDKFSDLKLIMQFIGFLVINYPEKMKDPNIRYKLLSIVIDNTGGSVERIKEILNPSPEKKVELQLKEQAKDFVRQQMGEPTKGEVPPIPQEMISATQGV